MLGRNTVTVTLDTTARQVLGPNPRRTGVLLSPHWAVRYYVDWSPQVADQAGISVPAQPAPPVQLHRADWG